MTGAGGVTVAQLASVLASISTQPTELGPVLPVDRLCSLEAFTLGLGDLLQCPHMLGLTLRLVPLVQHPHPDQRRGGVCQHPRGQAPDE